MALSVIVERATPWISPVFSLLVRAGAHLLPGFGVAGLPALLRAHGAREPIEIVKVTKYHESWLSSYVRTGK